VYELHLNLPGERQVGSLYRAGAKQRYDVEFRRR
jgi:hypothetical protein